MKNIYRILSLLLLAVLVLGTLAGCSPDAGSDGSEDEARDYSRAVTLDMNSETVKAEVTVHAFIDGDTTHFNLPFEINGSDVLKARYLAINTPESTGKIEEYGKTAASYTKERLSQATSIIIESDTPNWDVDSTGGRYLVWVWYKTAEDTEYRNLNIEILQNGLAIASSSANNRYGETCMAAIAQAKRDKLNVYSGAKDPNFYYGEAIELTLKELRCNVADYEGQKVAFNGVITLNDGQSVYIEDYDPETDMYYGISIYYGYGLSGAGLDIISVGNQSRIVGTLQYYEVGGTYQVSGLTYRQMKPDDPGNIQKISDGHSAAYVLTSPETFVDGKVTVSTGEDTTETYDYAALAMDTSIRMEGLKVVSARTTVDENSSQKGAISLYCEADGVSVVVRTTVLRDENGNIVTEDHFLGKTIDVKGIVDYFSGDYQIKVFTLKDIVIHD